MKTKFLAAVVLAIGVLGSSTAPASAWGDWLPGWGCCCGYNRNLNIQVSVPYNAFTPFCAGRSVTYGRSNCPNSCGNPGYGNGCGFNGGCGFSNCGPMGCGPMGFCPPMGGWGVGGPCCGPICPPMCPCDPCACASDSKTPTTTANGVSATPLMAQNETTVPVQMPGMPMAGVPGPMPMQMPMQMGYPMAQPVGYMVPMNYGYYPMHPNYGAYGY
jgi:hypothetical protein